MKTFKSTALILMFFFVGLSYAQELYTNANAASIANEANSTIGWTANSASAVSSVQDEVYNGSYSLKITATSAGWALATYDFNTEIGEVYNISIYAKAASSKTPGFFQWDGFSDFQSQGISSSNWTLYSFSVTASASTATIKVYTGNTYPAAIGDAAYIDYISIQKASSDTQAPTAPVVSSNGQTQTTVDLSWTTSTDNVGVTGYKVYRDGTEIESNNTTTSYQATGLTASTAYNFKVRAFDAAGNESVDSNIIPVTTNSSSDTQAPTAPVLSSSAPSENTVNLSWTTATDNVGVTGYKVYRDGTEIESNITTTSYVATGLSASTTYNFKVRAFDAAGNQSVDSNIESITTSAASSGGSSVWSEAGTTASYTGEVAIGTTTVPTGYKIAVDGKLITEEVRVEISNTWPDYVFTKDHDLPTLEEIKKHIEDKGHLPNIPSAEEVEANGVELGEMNRLLLEKIEEMMLHIIQLESRLNEVESTFGGSHITKESCKK